MDIVCIRCGRKAETLRPDGWPEGWEGSIHGTQEPYAPVCPGCQYAEWHPHCRSLIDMDGERVNPAAMPREEIDWNRLEWCDYIDLSVSWIEEDDEPKDWRCPECDGTEFEGVHRDYPPAGLKGSTFTVDVEDLDEAP